MIKEKSRSNESQFGSTGRGGGRTGRDVGMGGEGGGYQPRQEGPVDMGSP